MFRRSASIIAIPALYYACSNNRLSSSPFYANAESSSSSSITTTATTISSSSKVAAIPKGILKLRPKDDEYDRIDTKLIDTVFKHMIDNHALHDTLNGEKRIEVYEVYQKKSIGDSYVDIDRELVCLIKFGDALNGHPNIVHGGITALCIDNTYGWLFFSQGLPPSVTANLNINYRSALFANTCCVLRTKIDKIDGRKIYMSASLHTDSGVLIADSTTLFIMMKNDWQTYFARQYIAIRNMLGLKA